MTTQRCFCDDSLTYVYVYDNKLRFRRVSRIGMLGIDGDMTWRIGSNSNANVGGIIIAF